MILKRDWEFKKKQVFKLIVIKLINTVWDQIRSIKTYLLYFQFRTERTTRDSFYIMKADEISFIAHKTWHSVGLDFKLKKQIKKNRLFRRI